MGGGFAPRFAAEALFLILLAVGAGLADLRPRVVVAVMAVGWLLVSLIEYFVWRAAAQTALRVGTLARRPPEAAPGWSVEEILVPELELEPDGAEPVVPAEPTTVLPPEEAEAPEAEEATEAEAEPVEDAEAEPVAQPEPGPAPKRRRRRRAKETPE